MLAIPNFVRAEEHLQAEPNLLSLRSLMRFPISITCSTQHKLKLHVATTQANSMRFFGLAAVATFSTAVLAQGFDNQIPQCAVRALHLVTRCEC
jgi:hypothetical protein